MATCYVNKKTNLNQHFPGSWRSGRPPGQHRGGRPGIPGIGSLAPKSDRLLEGTLRNCIVVGHTDDVFNGTKTINVTYSCIGTADTFWTHGVNGCLLWNTADPLFKERSSGDYRLADDAVVMNVGTNRYWMADTQDLDGNARIVYGTVDMGCYEIQKAKGTIVLVR